MAYIKFRTNFYNMTTIEELNKLFEAFINTQKFMETHFRESMTIEDANRQLNILANKAHTIISNMHNPRINNQMNFNEAEKHILSTFRYLKLIYKYVEAIYHMGCDEQRKSGDNTISRQTGATLRNYNQLYRGAITVIKNVLDEVEHKITQEGFNFYHSFVKNPTRYIQPNELTVNVYRNLAKAIKAD